MVLAMKKFHVLHLNREAFIKFMREGGNPSRLDYDLVAAVSTEGGLDKVFELTNHIDHNWADNPEVACMQQSRSTSVGDILMEWDGTCYRCADVGWIEGRFVDGKFEENH
jgi:hypothetical protein